MNREKFLPIGSVVLLKEGKSKIMITGFAIKSEETGDKIYDYMGCLYPIGVVSSDQNLVFDHDQIQTIFYLGYNDNEWKATEIKIKEKLVELTQQTDTNDTVPTSVQ